MKFFRKRQPEGVPGWAATMNVSDFELFMELAEKSIRKHHIKPVIHREEGYWSPAGMASSQYGLHNLVQMCAMTVPLEWSEIIDDHMNKVLNLRNRAWPEDFETAKDNLKIRLLPLDTEVTFEFASYPVCDRFLTVLAVDFPDSVALLKQESVEKWPVAKSQLFDLALENMWEQNRPVVRPWDERTPKLLEFSGNDFFVSSHILLLDRHLPSTSYGTLVIAPARELAFAHVIEDMSVAQDIGLLIRLANDIYREAPGPVTPSLLWWRDGKFTDLPWEPVGEQISFTPPPDFIEMMESLS